jgi:hypothetical protein
LFIVNEWIPVNDYLFGLIMGGATDMNATERVVSRGHLLDLFHSLLGAFGADGEGKL